MCNIIGQIKIKQEAIENISGSSSWRAYVKDYPINELFFGDNRMIVPMVSKFILTIDTGSANIPHVITVMAVNEYKVNADTGTVVELVIEYIVDMEEDSATVIDPIPVGIFAYGTALCVQFACSCPNIKTTGDGSKVIAPIIMSKMPCIEHLGNRYYYMYTKIMYRGMTTSDDSGCPIHVNLCTGAVAMYSKTIPATNSDAYKLMEMVASTFKNK